MRLLSQFFSLILLFQLPLTVSSQVPGTSQDSLLTTTAYDHALRVYHAALSPEPGLYRGSQYVDYAYLITDGHPFFDNGKVKKGVVLYNGILYDGVPLLYDLVLQQLLTYDPTNTYKIALIGEQIDSFTIGNHIFIHLRDSADPGAPRAGYYEQLYKGKSLLLKKEKKTMQEDVSNPNEGLKHYVTTAVSYYVKKGGTWYSVNTKRSLLHAFKDKSRELKKFMRTKELSIHDDKEQALLQVTARYDDLNP